MLARHSKEPWPSEESPAWTNNNNNNGLGLLAVHKCTLLIGKTEIQVELESGNVGFWGEGKTEVPGEKLLGAKTRTNNKLNPHNYHIYLRMGRTFFKEKNVRNLGCGLHAGTRVLSSLICKISRHTQSQEKVINETDIKYPVSKFNTHCQVFSDK